ncbi:MAG: T9SS type A sorting domain-containing protein [Rhodothermales bacterium]|nr:T9SS type A sorting domain-containing protein [Rhodothermales bacterium]
MTYRLLLSTILAFVILFDSSGQVVINEIDYDQPGTDDAEFVEIFNGGIVSVDLSSYTLELVNGTGGGASIDESIPLTGSVAPFGYYVVCQSIVTVPNCDQESIASFQNGSPDAAGLRDGTNALVDAVSYEGDTGAPYTEGAGTSAADNSTNDHVGLSRSPESLDTDNNDADFTLRCSTAGAVNSLESTNCDTLPVEIGEIRLVVNRANMVLLWETLSEIDTDGFEVQELTSGSFEFRGFVPAHGSPGDYRFDIGSRGPGEYTFRLRIINSDGTSDYSNSIESLIDSRKSITVSDAYPNPFESVTDLRVSSGLTQRVRVTVYDVLGRTLVMLLDEYMDTGEVRLLTIDGSNLPAGVYFYTIEGNNIVVTKSVVLSR